MTEANAKCDDCGRFLSYEAPGTSYADKYDFVAMCCDYQHWRCSDCTARLGPVHSNARPYNGDMIPYQGIILAPAKTKDADHV